MLILLVDCLSYVNCRICGENAGICGQIVSLWFYGLRARLGRGRTEPAKPSGKTKLPLGFADSVLPQPEPASKTHFSRPLSRVYRPAR